MLMSNKFLFAIVILLLGSQSIIANANKCGGQRNKNSCAGQKECYWHEWLSKCLADGEQPVVQDCKEITSCPAPPKTLPKAKSTTTKAAATTTKPAKSTTTKAAATTKKPAAEQTIAFEGNYNDVVGSKKTKFLEECTKGFTSKSLDVECSDVRAGSIIVTVRGKVADVATAVKDVRDNGLDLPSFDALVAKPDPSKTTIAPKTTQKGGIDNLEPWIVPTFSAMVIGSLVILILAVVLGVSSCAQKPSGGQGGSKIVPKTDDENPAKQDAGDDGDDGDDESPGLSERMRKKSNAELEEIIHKDSAAVERYNSLAKEGKEDEYKSDLSVKELQELVEDLGY